MDNFPNLRGYNFIWMPVYDEPSWFLIVWKCLLSTFKKALVVSGGGGDTVMRCDVRWTFCKYWQDGGNTFSTIEMEHLLFSYFDLAFHLKGSLCANISTLIWDISTDKLFLCIFCFAEFITESGDWWRVHCEKRSKVAQWITSQNMDSDIF